MLPTTMSFWKPNIPSEASVWTVVAPRSTTTFSTTTVTCRRYGSGTFRTGRRTRTWSTFRLQITSVRRISRWCSSPWKCMTYYSTLYSIWHTDDTTKSNHALQLLTFWRFLWIFIHFGTTTTNFVIHIANLCLNSFDKSNNNNIRHNYDVSTSHPWRKLNWNITTIRQTNNM